MPDPMKYFRRERQDLSTASADHMPEPAPTATMPEDGARQRYAEAAMDAMDTYDSPRAHAMPYDDRDDDYDYDDESAAEPANSDMPYLSRGERARPYRDTVTMPDDVDAETVSPALPISLPDSGAASTSNREIEEQAEAISDVDGDPDFDDDISEPSQAEPVLQQSADSLDFNTGAGGSDPLSGDSPLSGGVFSAQSATDTLDFNTGAGGSDPLSGDSPMSGGVFSAQSVTDTLDFNTGAGGSDPLSGDNPMSGGVFSAQSVTDSLDFNTGAGGHDRGDAADDDDDRMPGGLTSPASRSSMSGLTEAAGAAGALATTGLLVNSAAMAEESPVDARKREYMRRIAEMRAEAKKTGSAAGRIGGIPIMMTESSDPRGDYVDAQKRETLRRVSEMRDKAKKTGSAAGYIGGIPVMMTETKDPKDAYSSLMSGPPPRVKSKPARGRYRSGRPRNRITFAR